MGVIYFYIKNSPYFTHLIIFLVLIYYPTTKNLILKQDIYINFLSIITINML